MDAFDPTAGSDDIAAALPRWTGEPVDNLTVDPGGTPRLVRGGCHERLHARVVGEADPLEILPEAPVELFRGTKVDLALVGWAQIHADGMTDRVHVDAPDGFEEGSIVRRFARVHEAGALRLTFYPSMDTRRAAPPARLRLDRSGPRVPVRVAAKAT